MATYKGDTPLITYDFGEDVTDLSTTPKINHQKPDGTTGSWTATLSTQYAQYQALTGDIDESGVWYVQPQLSDGTKTYYGERRAMLVQEPIAVT